MGIFNILSIDVKARSVSENEQAISLSINVSLSPNLSKKVIPFSLSSFISLILSSVILEPSSNHYGQQKSRSIIKFKTVIR